MRAVIARAIVHWAGGWYETSYEALEVYGLGHNVSERIFGVGSIIERVLFPVARRLDREAYLDQLVHEGWWG